MYDATGKFANKKVLRIIRGQELNLQISNDICMEDSFMYPAYRQAVLALKEIIRQTQKFHVDYDYSDNKLFQYGGNVIAFLAERGGGKTRTMMSFAEVLRQASNDSKRQELLPQTDSQPFNIEEYQFDVLSPIAPSLLERDQNILYIVLSRLYQYAEKLLRPGSLCEHITERDKNELYQAFHSCLSGINGIKKRSEGDLMEDLSSLQDLNDGNALKRHFYTLIQSLLKVSKPRNMQKCFLVIQIDDADTNVKKAYEVLEDIRRYLLLPNLVVLMSADPTMLHNAVRSSYTKFMDPMRDKYVEKDLSRICRKYLDKLIPPSHAIYLPELDKYLEMAQNQLELLYVEDSEKHPPAPEMAWMKDIGDFQTTLLMLIYRKTGIVFARPSMLVHNIIPRTMRGLNQLLHLLVTMKDIPRLNEKYWNDMRSFTYRLFEIVHTTEENLRIFCDYFIKDWIPVKINDSDDRWFLTEFSRTVSINRVRLAVDYLVRKYEVPNENLNLRIYDNVDLERILVTIEKTHRSQDDLLLFFAIRTVLTIESHQMVIWHKREKVYAEVVKMNEIKSYYPPIFVFDYNPATFNLPHSYYIKDETKQVKLGNCCCIADYLIEHYIEYKKLETEKKREQYCFENKLSYSFLKKFHDVYSASNLQIENDCFDEEFSLILFEFPFCIENLIDKVALSDVWKEFSLGGSALDCAKSFFAKVMTRDADDSQCCISALNLITLFLRFGNVIFEAGGKSKAKEQEEIMKQQRMFYQIQESALLIAANWDVQGRMYKYLVGPKESEDNNDTFVGLLMSLYDEIDEIIGEINQGKLIKYINSENTQYSIRAALDNCLTGNSLDTILDAQTILNCIGRIVYIEEADAFDPEKEKNTNEPAIPNHDETGLPTIQE